MRCMIVAVRIRSEEKCFSSPSYEESMEISKLKMNDVSTSWRIDELILLTHGWVISPFCGELKR